MADTPAHSESAPNVDPSPSAQDALRPQPAPGASLGVLAGYWSTNIGNAFFQLGAEWLLKRCLPSAHTFLIGDEPGYWNVKKGNPAEALDYVAHLEVDAIVLQGPIFRPEMRKIVEPVMRAQAERGGKIIILAAGMMQYDPATVASARSLLEAARPWIFTTRDSETFEAVGDIPEHAYDGIDVATFVTDLFPPVPTNLPPYMVMNFDQIPEPKFVPASAGGEGVFPYGDQHWRPVQPKLRTELAYKSRAYLFGEALLPRSTPPGTFAGLEVVRTDHRYNPFLPRKTYKGRNTYVGDIPHTYLNLYAHSNLTLSNRVHACVATAAYGNPAMLFTRSPRAYLLKRLGLDTVKERPTTIDLGFLRDEKAKLIEWLTERLAPLADG